MKTISELRKVLRFTPHELNSHIGSFAEHSEIDFDVYLPTRKMNLQRDFVWELHQKRELIWSILMKRNIPRMAMMNIVLDDNKYDGVYQIIDGKQRLSTMIDFYRNKFTLLVDGLEYLFKELPEDYRKEIQYYPFAYYVANEERVGQFTDQDKIDWFTHINFAGTPQDSEHFEKIKGNA